MRATGLGDTVGRRISVGSDGRQRGHGDFLEFAVFVAVKLAIRFDVEFAVKLGFELAVKQSIGHVRRAFV